MHADTNFAIGSKATKTRSRGAAPCVNYALRRNADLRSCSSTNASIPLRTIAQRSVAHPYDRQERLPSRGMIPHPIRADVEALGYLIGCKQRFELRNAPRRLAQAESESDSSLDSGCGLLRFGDKNGYRTSYP